MSEISEEYVEQFETFFKEFRDDEGSFIWRDRIERMPLEESRSLIIDFNDVRVFDPALAELVEENPEQFINSASTAVKNVMKVIDPDYYKKIDTFHARFLNPPEQLALRKIRSVNIGSFVQVEGILTRASEVKPLLIKAMFICTKCGYLYEIPQDKGYSEPTICENPSCRKKGPFKLLMDESTFTDWQKIRIQEMPEELPPGQLPRSLDVIIKDDLVDIARPGDRVGIIGVLRSVPDFTKGRLKTPTFSVYLASNYIDLFEKGLGKIEITPEEEQEIKDLSQDVWIHQKLIRSIAPSIYGYENIKEAIALLLFGGTSKVLPDGMKIRGESNILLVGDPGTAKSQLLQYVARIAPRALYTSGKGSTAAGLTAAVMRDADTGEMTLEAGALVLSDMGVACIDEFDKMRTEDRVAIHEAMEQHSYHPLTEIFLADGARESIGELVDNLFANNPKKIVQGINCEILDARPFNLEVFTSDFLKVDRICIDRVSRHPAPEYFFKIKFGNGRHVIVTPEHPLFVFKGDSISVVSATDIQVGDFVPAPRIMPCGHNPGALLNTEIPIHFNAKSIALPEHVTPKIARLLGYFVSEGYSYNGSSAELGFSNTLDLIVKDISSLMKDLFGLEGINYIDRNRTLRFVSAQLRDFFRENFPEVLNTSKYKRIPSQLFVSGELVVKQFLKAAFLGDGSLESETLSYRTSSPKLALDYQDLLLCVGIQSRIVHDSYNDSYKVCIRGSSLPLFFQMIVEQWDLRREKISKLVNRSAKSNYDHDVFPPGIGVKIKKLFKQVGIPYKGTFYRAINEGHGITRTLLQKHLDEAKNAFNEAKTHLKKLPLPIKATRRILHWSLETAGRKINRSGSFIGHLERGGCTDETKKKVTIQLADAVFNECQQIEKEINEIERILESDIRCLRIKKIEKIANSGKWACPFVYDVTVEPTHRFISQGLILHNTVSIAKAGIIATLNARTSILAAANPYKGRYNIHGTPAENIRLPVTILSRFDLLFTITDKPDAEYDREIAEHILRLHAKSDSIVIESPIDPVLLRKYIAFAKSRIRPKLTREAGEKLQEFYLRMRKAGEDAGAPIPITARQLEALVRISEARAKMALREEVSTEDAEAAIRLMKYSLQQVGVDESGRYDIDSIMLGQTKSTRDKISELLDLIKGLEVEMGGSVPISKLIKRAEDAGFEPPFVKRALDNLQQSGEIYEPKSGFIKRISGS